MIDILRDPKTGSREVIHVCYECDPETYPTGKPIVDDINAKKDSKGNWICSECQEEDLNKMFLKTLGPNHEKCKRFIAAEDRKVLEHNNAAKKLNDHSGQYLMRYKRNRYTGRMLLSLS